MRTLTIVGSLAIILSGCTSFDSNRNPELSNLDLDEKSVPEAVLKNLPMPEPQAPPDMLRADAASLWQTGSRGFFGDQRATQIGDILTVLIEINDKATLENESSRARTSNNTARAPTFLGYEGKLADILPGVAQADLSPTNLVDLGSRSASSGEGSIERNEKISLKVAAMVMKVLPNNNFVIAGKQEVLVNNELRELRVAGIVRPVDIEMNNSIGYEKVAEARISYGGRGQISRVQNPRYGEDFLDTVLPY